MTNRRNRGGSPIEPPPYFQPSPLGDWNVFEYAAMPVWLDWYQRHRRLPSKRELQRYGHGDLVWAAYAYHGGLRSVHRRLGFSRVEQKHNGRDYRLNWYDPAVLTGWLESHFPQLLTWGIAPPEKYIRAIKPNPNSYATAVGGWKKLVLSHGWRPYVPGRREQQIALAIMEALSLFEDRKRWPKKSECSPLLRRVRYRRQFNWPTFVRQDDFHPAALDQLVERWKRHYAWAATHQPVWAATVHAHINHLILTIHQRRPFGRSSP